MMEGLSKDSQKKENWGKLRTVLRSKDFQGHVFADKDNLRTIRTI